jgi:hypothetical protein
VVRIQFFFFVSLFPGSIEGFVLLVSVGGFVFGLWEMDFLLVGLLLLLVYVVVFRLLSRPSLFNVVAALVLLALVAFRGYRVLFSPPPLLRLTRAELAKFTGADGQVHASSFSLSLLVFLNFFFFFFFFFLVLPSPQFISQ